MFSLNILTRLSIRFLEKLAVVKLHLFHISHNSINLSILLYPLLSIICSDPGKETNFPFYIVKYPHITYFQGCGGIG